MNDLLNKIAENFRHFPGIGPRQQALCLLFASSWRRRN